MAHEDWLEEACARSSETADLDFKSALDPALAGDLLELIKDIVAMANSGGGVILVGCNDNGTPISAEITPLAKMDPADLGNQLHKYTDQHFHAFEIVAAEKGETPICAMRIGAAPIPIVFTRVGTYETSHGKQKNVFSVGTVYFRHGAKSEPGTSNDLRAFFDREIERVRRTWLDGIAKVVDAPAGARIAVLPPAGESTSHSGALPLRLTNDPDAPPYYAVPIDSTHPYRQKEVVQEVNSRLTERKTINAHDIRCIRRVHSIQEDIKFCYTQKFATARYSQAFVDWIVQQFEDDAFFFEKTKHAFDAIQKGAA